MSNDNTPTPTGGQVEAASVKDLKWVIKEFLAALPERRDWLNPDLEKIAKRVLEADAPDILAENAALREEAERLKRDVESHINREFTRGNLLEERGAELARLREEIAEREAHAYEKGIDNARSGIQEILLHPEGEDGCDELDGMIPVCRVQWYHDPGDSDVGDYGWAGWVLARDQSGTSLSTLREANAGLVEALKLAAPWMRAVITNTEWVGGAEREHEEAKVELAKVEAALDAAKGGEG